MPGHGGAGVPTAQPVRLHGRTIVVVALPPPRRQGGVATGDQEGAGLPPPLPWRRRSKWCLGLEGCHLRGARGEAAGEVRPILPRVTWLQSRSTTTMTRRRMGARPLRDHRGDVRPGIATALTARSGRLATASPTPVVTRPPPRLRRPCRQWPRQAHRTTQQERGGSSTMTTTTAPTERRCAGQGGHAYEVVVKYRV